MKNISTIIKTAVLPDVSSSWYTASDVVFALKRTSIYHSSIATEKIGAL